MKQHTITISKFITSNGQALHEAPIAFWTEGQLNEAKDNVIWVCHALTANADVAAWWPGMVGPGLPIDTRDYYIVCVNVPGSCYGSVGPLSINPVTGEPYYHTFPKLTAADAVTAFQAVVQHLGIKEISLLIGASLGGQHALHWAAAQPHLFNNALFIATNARHSPWGIAWNEAQRLAIRADQTWQTNTPTAGQTGMEAARATALLSYRNAYAFNATQPRNSKGIQPAITYQRYQGQKLAKRFNAYSYYKLSQMMDAHDLGAYFDTVEQGLNRIKANSLVIGISSDILFPPSEQKLIAEHIPNASYLEIDSLYGHDGFLIEVEAIGKQIRKLLRTNLACAS